MGGSQSEWSIVLSALKSQMGQLQGRREVYNYPPPVFSTSTLSVRWSRKLCSPTLPRLSIDDLILIIIRWFHRFSPQSSGGIIIQPKSNLTVSQFSLIHISKVATTEHIESTPLTTAIKSKCSAELWADPLQVLLFSHAHRSSSPSFETEDETLLQATTRRAHDISQERVQIFRPHH